MIPINSLVLPYIKHWYEIAVASGQEHLIVNNAGKKKDVKNFRSREFYPVLEELGIQGHVDKEHPARLTPHSTRHTFASLAVRSGMAPEILQKIIGHADYSTTADIYIHENLDDLKNGIELIKRSKSNSGIKTK